MSPTPIRPASSTAMHSFSILGSGHLLPKQPPHPPQHTIFLRIVRMILTRDLEYRREVLRVCVNRIPYPLCDLPTMDVSKSCLHSIAGIYFIMAVDVHA